MREWDEYRDVGHRCCARRWLALFFVLNTSHALPTDSLEWVVTYLVTYREEQRGNLISLISTLRRQELTGVSQISVSNGESPSIRHPVARTRLLSFPIVEFLKSKQHSHGYCHVAAAASSTTWLL